MDKYTGTCYIPVMIKINLILAYHIIELSVYMYVTEMKNVSKCQRIEAHTVVPLAVVTVRGEGEEGVWPGEGEDGGD